MVLKAGIQRMGWREETMWRNVKRLDNGLDPGNGEKGVNNLHVLESKIWSSNNQKNSRITVEQDILCKGLSKAPILFFWVEYSTHQISETGQAWENLWGSGVCLLSFSAPFLLHPSAWVHGLFFHAKEMNSIRCGLIKVKAVPSPRGSYILKGDPWRNKALRQKRMHLQVWKFGVVGLIFQTSW